MSFLALDSCSWQVRTFNSLFIYLPPSFLFLSILTWSQIQVKKWTDMKKERQSSTSFFLPSLSPSVSSATCEPQLDQTGSRLGLTYNRDGVQFLCLTLFFSCSLFNPSRVVLFEKERRESSFLPYWNGWSFGIICSDPFTNTTVSRV